MWKQFRPHRMHVTDLLTALSPPRGALCLLGAGGVNDVSLEPLLVVDRDIHLVDVDLPAMQAGVARQGLGKSSAVHLHAIDLSGIAELLADADLRRDRGGKRMLESLAAHRCTIPGQPFDMTVSMGLLTQLIRSVVISELPPTVVSEVVIGLRDKHLGDLVHLTTRGGRIVLISDVVSTATAPELSRIPEVGLGAAMGALIARGNFFTGTNPYRLSSLLAGDPRFRDEVTDVHLHAPWLWHVRPQRQHLVYAITARRRDRTRMALAHCRAGPSRQFR
jgi:hypothetical protein